jgi:carboxyl-terminal processing protease
MDKKNKKLRNTIIVILAILLTNTLTAGVLLYSPATGYGQFDKLLKIKQILIDNYIDKIDKAKEDKMADAEIRAMVDSLGDPYTVYMDAKEYKAFNTQIAGSYAGIGIYVGEKAGKIIVIAPIEGSPAEKAGVKAGDIIVAVNDKNVTGKDMDKAVSMMLGKPHTTVKITFNRAGKGNFLKLITREQIVIKSVKAEMLKDKIGYIKIAMFGENTSDEFIKALNSLESQGEKGLIIDLRDNGGGLLNESGRIADKLLGKGTIVYTIDNKNHKEVWTSDASKFNKPLVLLVNGGTASASEILSGAVRDFKAGTLIGTKTFGKGIVQMPQELSDGSAVKVTIAKYYTPSGECIQKIGIKPNIVLDLDKKAKAEYKNGAVKESDDNQLLKGIEVIKSKF